MWLEDVRIGYGELGAWLRQLRSLATTVTRWRPPKQSSQDPERAR
jgi:hypothetical protein